MVFFFCSFLITSLLENEEPLNLDWAEFPDENHYELNRYLYFEFVPVGLISRLLVRILNLFPPGKDTEASYVWKNGIFMKDEKLNFIVRFYYSRNELEIIYRGYEKDTSERDFCNMISAANRLIEEWTHLEPQSETRCIGCIENRISSNNRVGLKTLEDLSRRSESIFM